ncbi:hypothetical protein [Lewinella sp. LCG006]|uniref:hypothetical protein n=1 Tax=Lewinella sp. LCG006 TaxID=3231911 RepID=UPI003461631B
MKLLTSLLLFLITVNQTLAQSSSESPYSDQTFDPAVHTTWHSHPLTIGSIILIGAIILLVIRKKR